MKEFKKGIGVEPEVEQAATPQPMPAPQACAHCKNLLETGWSHGPRCGTPVVQEPPPPK
jgi:hypothetical protein